MVDKTPVTILQELSVAHGVLPTFELIHDGTGALTPCFRYKANVCIENNPVNAIGSGRSKKEAKHDSAKQALQALEDLGYKVISESAKLDGAPLPRFVDPNSVILLLELCEEMKLPMPEYKLISDTGPPHARQFTMMCRVASLQQSATATTKKAAKQLAASLMVDIARTFGGELSGKELVVATDIKLVTKILDDKQNRVILTRRFSDYDDPLIAYDEDLCNIAWNTLMSEELNDEEKFKITMDCLKFDYMIEHGCKTCEGNQMVRFIIMTEPEFTFTEYTMADGYKTIIDYLKQLLPH